MAELKPIWPLDLDHVFGGLHGFTAVAELKLIMTPLAVAQQTRLHGFTAVAELKRRENCT